MALQFNVEPFDNLWPEINALWLQHKAEIVSHWAPPLNPNISMYRKLDAAGALKCITARNPTGHLVGYYFMVRKRNLHYQVVTASDDIYYLHPDWRHGWNGVKLFLEAERVMRELNVVINYVHEKITNPVKPILDRLGYSAIETIYQKAL